MGGAARAERRHSRRFRLPEALPSLGPVATRIYVAIWSLLLLAAIVTPVLNVYFQTQRRAEPTWDAIGLSVQSASQRLIISRVLTPQARSAGLMEGDVILAVEGAAISGSDSGASVGRRLLGPEGSIKRLTVSSDGAPARQVTLRRSVADIEASFHAAGITSAFWDWFIAAISLFTCLLLIVAAILLFGRRRQPVAALLSAGYLAFAGLGNFGANVQLHLPSALVAILNVMGAAGWACILLAIVTFPDGRFRPRWSLAVAAATGLYSVVTLLVTLSFAWRSLASGVMLAACIASLARRYRGVPPGVERQQLRWTFLGFSGGTALLLAGLLMREGIRALSHHDLGAQIWGTLASSFLFSLGFFGWTLGLSVSLLRYRLFDADAVIGRSATLGVLTILLLGIFAGSEKIIEVLGEEYFGEGLGALAGGLGAAIAAVMLVPLHHRVNQWAERRFQKDLHNMRERLPLLVGDLRETAGLERIAAAVLDAVTKGVRASRAALLVGEKVEGTRGIEVGEVEGWRSGWNPSERDGLDCVRADPLFPMRVPLEADGHGCVGWLLLGPRPDGSFYGRDERAALAEIADPAARALEIVRLREERERQQESRLAAIERSLAAALRRLKLAGPVLTAAVSKR